MCEAPQGERLFSENQCLEFRVSQGEIVSRGSRSKQKSDLDALEDFSGCVTLPAVCVETSHAFFVEFLAAAVGFSSAGYFNDILVGPLKKGL